MLELVSVTAGYGETTVLRNVSLRVDTGTLVALVGANAAGKSTIAGVISGLVPVKSGEVRHDGASLDGIRAHERVRQGIVHVPEGRRLFPLLSVEETLVSASSFGMPRARRASNLERVYALFPKLSERRTQLASTMSGGEQQMLAIGRGLMSEPKFFILDEPSLGLAPKIVEQIFEVTRTLLEQKLTILLIEQHLKDALALCNYAYVVENGRILLEGSGRDLMSDDRMREAYLGKRHRDETARNPNVSASMHEEARPSRSSARGTRRPERLVDFSGFTYPKLLSAQASATPTKMAVVTPARSLTWKELDNEAARLSGVLLALGVGPGDKVGILMPNSCEWVAWAHGATGIGAVLVPVNTRFRAEELAYQLKASDTSVLVMRRTIGDIEFLGLVRNLVPEIAVAAPGGLRSAALPSLRHVVCLDATTGDPAGLLVDAEVRGLVPSGGMDVVRRAREAVRPQDPVIIQYTSGTTAFPKGAMLSHYGTARNAFQVNERLHIDADDRIFVPGPFFHVAGTTLGILLGLLAGATIYTLPRYEPAEVLDAIERERITVYNGVDSLFITLFKHPSFRASALASVRTGWIASSPEIVRMVHEDMGLRGIVNVFGISEASPNVTLCDLDDPIELRAQTCGYPHPDCELKIVDPATGEALPAGRAGEICFRGYSLMLGYYNNPAETAKAIDGDGWLHTGDRGLLRPTGELEYFGRIKDMLRVGGENLAPAEVEEVLSQHPKVRQSAVVGIPDDRLVEVPAAVVELKPGEACTADEIIAFCKERLAGFKVPRAVAFVDALPMTGSGKIQKFRLRQEVFNVGAGRK